MIRAYFVWLLRSLEVRRSRLGLDTLTESQLRDIGLTRGQVGAETGRAFWDHRFPIPHPAVGPLRKRTIRRASKSEASP